MVANRFEQHDADGDGRGDACDACPFDVADDRDGDGACADVDRCPTRINEDGLPWVRLSADHGRHRSVDTSAISPDGTTVVYSIAPEEPNRFELYSVPASGGQPVRLSSELSPAADVSPVPGFGSYGSIPFTLSPDSRHAIYRADPEQNLSLELYSVSLSGGGDPVRIDAYRAGYPGAWNVTPDGNTVVFGRNGGPQQASGMFAAPISGGPAVDLGAGYFEEVSYFSSDGYVVYRNGWVLYSAPLSGGSLALPLNDWATTAFNGGLLSDDGRYVVFESGGDLYSVRADGGKPVQINGELAPGSAVGDFAFGPDATVVFAANEQRWGRGIYRAAITGAGSAKIAPWSASTGEPHPVASPDRQYAVYRDGTELFALHVRDCVRVRLDSIPIGVDEAAAIGPDSARVVYRNDSGLYSVSIRGGPPVRLDVALPSDATIGEFGISRDGSTVAFATSRAGASWLYAVPSVGGEPELLDGPLGEPSFLGIAESAVVYYAAREGADSLALYSAPLPPDADADGIDRFCDSCPAVFNPDPTSNTDFDDDGLDCAHDNCPLVANGLQDDTDSDGVGDACDVCPQLPFPDVDGDGACSDVDNCMRANPYQRDDDHDGLGNLCDICPFDHDPGQEDSDRDSLGDACDCAPADPEVRWPAEVENVRAWREPGTGLHLDWDAAAGADNYSISRGSLSALDVNRYGGCLVEGLAVTSFVDEALPAPDEGLFYLVVGASAECRLGSPGFDSREFARWNTDPAACDGIPSGEPSGPTR
jgi:Tol biopolymer transport system component